MSYYSEFGKYYNREEEEEEEEGMLLSNTAANTTASSTTTTEIKDNDEKEEFILKNILFEIRKLKIPCNEIIEIINEHINEKQVEATFSRNNNIINYYNTNNKMMMNVSSSNNSIANSSISSSGNNRSINSTSTANDVVVSHSFGGGGGDGSAALSGSNSYYHSSSSVDHYRSSLDNFFLYDCEFGRIGVHVDTIMQLSGIDKNNTKDFLKKQTRFLQSIRNEEEKLPLHVSLNIVPFPTINFGWIAKAAIISDDWQESYSSKRKSKKR